MRKEIFLAILLAGIITIPAIKSEIVTGEDFVTFLATIHFEVSRYIEVDFGLGWHILHAIGRVRPGEVRELLVFIPPDAYVFVTPNTSIPVKLAIGIPNVMLPLEKLKVDNVEIPRGQYVDVVTLYPGQTFTPSNITATIRALPGMPAGPRPAGFILCVYDEYLTNTVCPTL